MSETPLQGLRVRIQESSDDGPDADYVPVSSRNTVQHWYRGTSLMRKAPHPYVFRRALGISLL